MRDKLQAMVQSCDTPAQWSECYRSARETAHMSTQLRRPANAPTVQMLARVRPEVREYVHDAAKASGVTAAYYIDLLLAEMAESAGGSLPRVQRPIPQGEELPISFAA